MKVREMQRKGFCRGCDKVLHKGTIVFDHYSHLNRGTQIFFCKDCMVKIGDMAKEIPDADTTIPHSEQKDS